MRLNFYDKNSFLYSFTLLACVTLMSHSEYLYTIQAESIHLQGKAFMLETLGGEGGLWAWMGSWLTQHFYHPWLGSLILVALWIAIYFLILRITGWKDWKKALAFIPQLLLLYQFLCLGYWIYYIKTPGYALIPTLVVLATCLCTWAVMIIILKYTKDPEWSTAEASRFTTNIQLKKKKRKIALTKCLLFLLFLILLSPKPRIYSLTLPDNNFYSEMKMYRAIDECRWEDVIEEHRRTKTPTNLMVMYKNIALMHSGRLQEMFKTNNCGNRPEAPESLLPKDTLQLSIARIAAPMIYYQYGQLNYSYQWAMTNSVKHGLSINALKTMVRCAIMNQEFDLAGRYIVLLKNTRYHRNWALQQESLMQSSTRLMQSEEFENIAPLTVDEGNQLDTDNGQCEQWILNHFADLLHPANPKLEEVIITTSLWAKDDIAFDIHFYNYVNAHPNDPIPPLYQEAAILLCNQENSPITLDNFPFDQFIADKFNRFVSDYNQLAQMQLPETETASRLKTIYGDTYWWYFYFYRDFELY